MKLLEYFEKEIRMYILFIKFNPFYFKLIDFSKMSEHIFMYDATHFIQFISENHKCNAK